MCRPQYHLQPEFLCRPHQQHHPQPEISGQLPDRWWELRPRKSWINLARHSSPSF